MEALANVAVEIGKCLWDSLAEPISYVFNPTKNLELLEREVNRLMNKSADIERRVEVEEVRQLNQRTNEVDIWLKEVQDLILKCERVLEEGKSHEQNRCLVLCCPRDCWLNYKLGKKMSQLCKDVRDHRDVGEFTILVIPLPAPPVREVPIVEAVGLDSMLSQVWNWLQQEHVGIVGIYGVGGVGKTTLLKKIYEEFRHKSHEFHVLWIVVSRQVNLKEIRESIRKDLGIKDDVWSNQSENGARVTLFAVLNTKKFVLLIDDIWKRLDVGEIGIPTPNPKNGSKIVFTTRSKQVCNDMKARKLKVPCMSPQEALQLFCKNVSEHTLNLHQDIPKYATEIVNECKGLPLALIRVGRAMASMKTSDEWARALRVLRKYPSEISDMVDDVYNLLRFSYDILNPTHQQCFLYCALFPEDSNIHKYDLIDLWIGEGFLGDTNNIYETRDRGEVILGRLKSACLLESGRVEKHVKMHDVICDMALWLARDEGKNDNKVIVEVYDEKIAKNISRWQEAERISLIGPGREIINLTEEPLVCSRLVTFLSDKLNLDISEQFFMSLQALRVLEINFLEIIFIASRGKFSRGIGGLINLRDLNLSHTGIDELPVEIAKLTSLLYLLLENTDRLRISKEVISSLLSLKVFRKTHRSTIKTEGFIEGVECLKQLDELSLTIHDAVSVRKLFEAPNLRRSIRGLGIRHCLDLASIDANVSRRLELTNLHIVYIWECNLVNLSWLIYAPNLQTLDVFRCDTLEVIFDEDILQTIDEDASARLFSSLRFLYLFNLPKLRSIHKGTLSSPMLTAIRISGCPALKKLPFDLNSTKNSLKQVRAGREWWSTLEWDDEAIKASFTEKFVPL